MSGKKQNRNILVRCLREGGGGKGREGGREAEGREGRQGGREGAS